MELLLKLFVVTIVLTLMTLVLKQNQPAFAFSVSILATLLILCFANGAVASVVRLLRTIAEQTRILPELLSPFFKVLAITILTKIMVDICKESGCLGMASGVEVIGNAIAITAAAPLILSMLSFLMSI